MYDGFTVKHFHEKLVERHVYRFGYTVTRLASGQVKRAARHGAHRRKRPRRPLTGMLLRPACGAPRLAGGPAAARPGGHARRRDERDLLGDPGRGGGHGLELPGAGRGGRGPWPLLRALHRPRQPLLPHAGGRRAGRPGASDPGRPGAGRALAELGIEHIAAYSPQARGRSERAFRTLEDRLPRELALAGITDLDAANAWLRAVYLPAHNARFAVAAEQEGSAFVPAAPHQWRELLCLRETRQVGNDNCVSWKGRSLQIPRSPLRAHFARATVRLHEYPDAAVALFWGPHRLADFPPEAATHDLAA